MHRCWDWSSRPSRRHQKSKTGLCNYRSGSTGSLRRRLGQEDPGFGRHHFGL
ncbi:BnaUnng04800D [Brassica napus]|uniref:Uncharacterized protein n=2 Tax=Brassica TaxID=3705 RepID=A0A3P6FAM5_BRAOL|nr:unnamed protein product [Brassica napus]CDY72012.1 BnaUnng04800D [Brassica napus]VDD49808.1 unnamed protein product [Brassica oleracea]